MTFKTTALRAVVGASTALLALAGLAACGGSESAPAVATTEAATTTAATEVATTAAVEDTKPAYAYMGYGDIPDNEDLTIMASQHYYAEYTEYYDASYDDTPYIEKSEVQEAYDYQNNAEVYKDEDGTITSYYAFIDGTEIATAPTEGYYYESQFDEGDYMSKEDILAEIEANDESASYLTFTGVAKEDIPYVDDGTEYDCYTYSSAYDSEDADGNSTTTTVTTKVFVQDSKLIAISTVPEGGNGRVYVYHNITSDIPDGFIALPDTTGLENMFGI